MILRNPITNTIEKSIDKTRNKLLIAVPFITSFVYKVLREDNSKNILHKRIITRFDEFNINSFNIPALIKLVNLGFEISFNNEIHLKLYIFDNEALLSSSNLTQSGFEKAIELSSMLSGEDVLDCENVFSDIWSMEETQLLTLQILNENLNVYNLLKRKSKPVRITKSGLTKSAIQIDGVDISKVIKYVFDANEDYSLRNQYIFKANKFREDFKSKIREEIRQIDFYAPVGHPNRNQSFFYQIIYGDEEKLAGTGLREEHFKSVFEDEMLEELIAFIYPPSIGKPAWNLNEDIELRKFCQGLFDFNIKSYAQVMPIRLASFFYPNIFYPIFNLNHLEEICGILGGKINSQIYPERLYLCTTFLDERLEAIPYSKYIKSSMLYQIKYLNLLTTSEKEGINDLEIIGKGLGKWERLLLNRAKIIISENFDL